MRKATKQRNILVALVLAFVAVIAALFSVFTPKSERLEASAAATYENENLKFAHNGAYGSALAYDMYILRYVLTINREIFDSQTEEFLWVTFYDFYSTGQVNLFYASCQNEADTETAKETYGAYFADDENTETTIKNLLYDSFVTIDGAEHSADPFVMRYSEDRLFSGDYANATERDLSIYVRAQYTRPVQLVACIGSDQGLLAGKNRAHAISDKRSVYEVLRNGYNAGDALVVNHPYFSELVKFGNGDSATFDIAPAVNLSAKDGLALTINLPTTLNEILTQDETEKWQEPLGAWVNWVTYSKYYLVITRAETKEDFNNTDGTLLSGSGYTHYYFDLGGNAKEAKNPNAQELNMWGGTLKEFRLPIPEDTNKTHYYYAQVVAYKVSGNKYTLGGFSPEYYPKQRYARTNTACEVNVKTLAQEILESDRYGLEKEQEWLQSISGLKPSNETVELQVSYMRVKNGSRIAVRDVFSIEIPAANVFSRRLAWNSLLNTPIPQSDGTYKYYHDITAFHAIIENREMYNGEWCSTGFRILRQAKGYSYEYNEISNIARLTIEYTPFEYKDFAIRVQSNETGSGLFFDYYTADVVESDGRVTLTFNYADMETHLSNFFINADDVDWVNSVGKNDFVLVENEGENYTCTFGEDTLTIETSAEFGDLEQLFIILYAPIEDGTIMYDASYRYKMVYVEDGTLTTQLKVGTIGKIPLSYLVRELSAWDNFYKDGEEIGDVKSTIDNATISKHIQTVDGAQGYYYVPCGITRNRNKDNLTCVFSVLYEENTLFEIRDTLTGYRKHVQALGGTTMYTANQLLRADELPQGYRVESVTATGATVRTGEDPEDYTQTTLIKNSNGIIPVTFKITDKWKLTINRMETYVNLAGVTTPFCTKKTDTVELSYSDYPDLTALAATDVAHILGYQALEDLRVCKIGLPYDDIEVTFNGSSTYTTTLEYGNSTLVALDTNGNTKTIEVPLTSFTDWADAFWKYDTTPNVLMLNTKKNTWFQTGEIRNQKIYGYFATAVFELQKSNIQDAFYNRKGDGCVTFFDKREVVGSDLYKFFEEQSHNGVLNGALASLGMIFCELWNDDNVTLESNFFYLDGTNTTDPYLSIGGADSSDDKDNAMENAGQDTMESIQNWWVNLNQDTGIETILKAVLAIVGIVGVAAICFWMLNKAGVFKTVAEASAKRTGARKPPATKSKVATSGSKKGTKKDGK